MRVLIVSANMGAGHDATGRALRSAVLRLWPNAEVGWTDVLDLMGRGVGPLFRTIYETSVQVLPGAYDYFYFSVWRNRWFARAAKAVIGSWSGRRLAGVIDRTGPDLIISTYPMATSGLEWLRVRRGLSVPTGAWISDFAPHPSWVHAGVDLNVVMHEAAVAPAMVAAPGAVVDVSAPPVPETFRPGDQETARRRLGLPLSGPIALVSCGSLGFGRAGESVAELLHGVPEGVVVVVAGRNERLRRELALRFGGDARVRVLGWTEDMAELMTAADIVVTNAGGATALEALACGRVVLMHEPIAGHGRANAELMARAGLARVCVEPGSLAAAARELHTDPLARRESEQAALRHLSTHRLEDGLRRLAGSSPQRPARPLRPADALFLHAESATAPQHVGTVLVFDTGPVPSAGQVAALLAAVPGVAGRLRTGPGGARWVPAELPDELVDVVDAAGGPVQGPVTDGFFSRPLDPGRQLAAARLVTNLSEGSHAVLVKLHHALADGVAVLQALLAETDGAAGRAWSTRPRLPVAGEHLPGRPGRVLRGLWRLAMAGRAPWTPFDRGLSDPGRHHQLISFPGRELRSTARALGLTVGELIPALFAEGVQDVMRPGPGSRFRLMVPWSVRGTESARLAGNQTGAVPVDLPVGPMPAATRARLVGRAMRGPAAAGVPEAAHTVVWALGALPGPVRAATARGIYHGRWFNGIGTVLPGPRREIRWQGARLAAAYPVLALAPGTGLAWGAMTWGDSVTMCLTTTSELEPLAGRLADAVRSALNTLTKEAAPR